MSEKETKTNSQKTNTPSDGKVLIHSLVPPTSKHPKAPPRPKTKGKEQSRHMNYDMISKERKDQKKSPEKPKGSIVPPTPSHPKAPPRPNKESKNT